MLRVLDIKDVVRTGNPQWPHRANLLVITTTGAHKWTGQVDIRDLAWVQNHGTVIITLNKAG